MFPRSCLALRARLWAAPPRRLPARRRISSTPSWRAILPDDPLAAEAALAEAQQDNEDDRRVNDSEGRFIGYQDERGDVFSGDNEYLGTLDFDGVVRNKDGEAVSGSGLADEERLDEDEDGGDQDPTGERREEPGTYRQFLDETAARYKHATEPQWNEGGVSRSFCSVYGNTDLRQPFPMNTSFHPPPPTSSVVQEKLWDLYMADPLKYTVRELAQLSRLSIGRVEAILRLKGLEKDWVKVSFSSVPPLHDASND